MNHIDLSGDIPILHKAKLAIKNRLQKVNTLMARYPPKIGSVISAQAKLQVAAGFTGKDFNLPVKVYGELLRPGKYYTGKISSSELKKAYEKLKESQKDIMLFTTHDAFWTNNTNLNDVVGKMFNFSWDSLNSAIRFEGDIYDDNAARKLVGGLVNGVSAGFVFESDDNGNNYDLEFKEATITFKPHAKNSFIQTINS